MTSQRIASDTYRAPVSRLQDRDSWYDATSIFNPSGRMGRIRFLGYSLIITLIPAAIVAILVGLQAAVSNEGVINYSDIDYWLTMGPYSLAAFVIILMAVAFAFIITVKRFHDMNRSAWWLLIFFTPYAGVFFDSEIGTIIGMVLYALATLALLLWPGTRDSNHYGLPARPPGTLMTWFVMIVIALYLTAIVASVLLPAYNDYVLSRGG